MKILFLAPQPFFQERGTPIAVRLALQVLAKRNNQVDFVTYHEGQDYKIDNINHIRACIPKFIKKVAPGISLKKIICDLFFTITVLKLVFFSKEKYSVIHSVEESVFIALIIKWIKKIPYIYDMDSSLSMQITEKWTLLKPLQGFLDFFEKMAIKNSVAVVPVCDALQIIAESRGAKDTQILRDISLLEKPNFSSEKNLKKIINCSNDDLLIVYIGNLESYQGIDLLIDSFSIAYQGHQQSQLVIIGGSEEHIKFYKDKSKKLNISDRVHLIGPLPVSDLSTYLLQADILASPRTKGNNTPMKIYSYLHSGKVVIATNLPTHTQVMDKTVSMLAEPNSEDFGNKLLELLENKNLRENLGNAAFQLAEEKYTFKVFERDLNSLYERLIDSNAI